MTTIKEAPLKVVNISYMEKLVHCEVLFSDENSMRIALYQPELLHFYHVLPLQYDFACFACHYFLLIAFPPHKIHSKGESRGTPFFCAF